MYKKIDAMQLALHSINFGGDEEDRTLDLTDANRTLSQLSYAPKLSILYSSYHFVYAMCQC